ncbi:MAG: DUF1249 domain-containing protein, partial [Kordiimonadaceae bacterium]|nr:DUF1249 domain-containing protein [Kordiimonadaceae bacterium]
MAVCDANYIRLLKLLGNTRSLSRRLVTMPQIGIGTNREQISVCIEVIEDFKYTSTISIKQLFTNLHTDRKINSIKDRDRLYKAPEMIVRVYHDAKTAEVMSYQNQKY